MHIQRFLPITLLFAATFFLSCGPNGPELDPAIVSGNVVCHEGSVMQGVSVTIFSDQFVVASTTTDANGNYELEVETGLDYILEFEYSDGTALDYEDQELFKDFLEGGATDFDDFQYLMMDLNGSGIIGTIAYVTMTDFIEQGTVTGWRFATEDWAFPSPGDPDGSGQYDQIELSVWEDMTINMVGLKMGDLNGSSCD